MNRWVDGVVGNRGNKEMGVVVVVVVDRREGKGHTEDRTINKA